MEYEAAKPPQDNADIQTEPVGVADSGNAAAFGPAKPSRTWVEPDGAEPLLQGAVDQGAIAAFAPDETRNYNDEGIGSVAGSLQSLDTDADEKDWKETLQVLGPKFSQLADYVRGGDEDEEDEDDDDDDDKRGAVGGAEKKEEDVDPFAAVDLGGRREEVEKQTAALPPPPPGAAPRAAAATTEALPPPPPPLPASQPPLDDDDDDDIASSTTDATAATATTTSASAVLSPNVFAAASTPVFSDNSKYTDDSEV